MVAPSADIEPWFEFASNYSYLSVMRIEEAARRRGVRVIWKPFRPEFKWTRLAQRAERDGGVDLLERRRMPPLGQFSVIRFRRSGAAEPKRAELQPS